MRDQIKARRAKLQRVAEQEAYVPKLAVQFATMLEEEFDGMQVRGVSDVVTVEDPTGRSPTLMGAYLQFSNGELLAVWNPRGPIDRSRRGERHERASYEAARLESLSIPWIKLLTQPRVLDSLIESIGGVGIDEREEQANDVIGQIRSLLSAESAAIDAEMSVTLEDLADDNLNRLWHEAIEAARSDSADALTRCSRFTEAVCSKILRERGVTLPKDKSMSPLVKACLDALTWPAAKEAESDVRQLLGGIQSITNGIGALRTHFGTAHGATSHLPPLDPGYAVFVKQATVAAATFLLDRHQASPLAVDDSSPAPAA